MAGGMDPSEFFDGGWEAGRDDGELLEDVMLGPVHPYDRPDGYTPAHRWSTRHQIISQPFADPAERLERGDTPAPAMRTRRGSARLTPSQASTRTAREPATAVPESGSKKQRQAELAQAMGWTPAELKAFRLRMAAAFTTIKDVKGKTTRRQALADTLGLGLAELQRFQDVETRINGAGPASPVHQTSAPPHQKPGARSTRPVTREDLVRESMRLGRLLTSSGAEAQLYETGWLLGISRPDVMRILQPRAQTTPSRQRAEESTVAKATRAETGLQGPPPGMRQSRVAPPAEKVAFCPACGARVDASGWCRCS